MKLPQMTAPMIMAFGIVIFMGYLLYVGELSNEIFVLLGGVLFVLIIYAKQEKDIINLAEARKIALASANEFQRRGEIEDGTVKLMGETGLKYFVVNSVIEPNHYEIGILIEGESTVGYMLRVSIYGSLLQISKLDLPTTFRVRKIKDLTTIEASPEHLKKDKDLKERAATDGEVKQNG